jgi:hypothetical protein
MNELLSTELERDPTNHLCTSEAQYNTCMHACIMHVVDITKLNTSVVSEVFSNTSPHFCDILGPF